MMIVTGKQMKEIDRTAIEDFKIPGLKLMETAGQKVYDVILEEIKDLKSAEVTVLCGAGNNGGDGYVIARKLHSSFIHTKVYSTVDITKLSGDAKVNYLELIKLGVTVEEISGMNFEKLERDVLNSAVVVDAILGTGINRDIDEKTKDIIAFANVNSKKIISVDIPSGVGAADGKIYGTAIRAYKTVTFQLPKLGCVIYPGAEFTGALVVTDIGIPEDVIFSKASNYFLIDESYVKMMIRKRKKNIHKGTCGTLLIIAGSKGMAGAAILCARAALRSGAGLVKMAVPPALNDIIQISVPEAVCISLWDEDNEQNELKNLDILYQSACDSDAVIIGPGLGKSPCILKVIKKIIGECQLPVIIDADGINALQGALDILKKAKASIVLTPHPGEMGRLVGCPAKEINENRIDLPQRYAVEWGISLVLKGAATVVASRDRSLFINTSGNPGMATGGSGDVLSGIIASLAAQGIYYDDAARAGVYLHGRAGDIMAEKVGEYGLIASDLALGAALAIKEIVDKG